MKIATAGYIFVAGTTLAVAEDFPSPETLSFVERANEAPQTRITTTVKQFVSNIEWLATAIYFEARNQSEDHQLRVARVVLNRVNDSRWPNTIQGVVAEDEHLRNRCQFSFMCDGEPEEVTNMRAWETSIKIAIIAYREWQDGHNLGCALYYRADYTTSKRALKWFASLKKQGQHGAHIFYCDPEV